MKKLLFILLFSVLTLGCSPESKDIPCETTADCSDGMFCSEVGYCFGNACENIDGETINCGKGECIPTGDGTYKCECEENAVLVEKSGTTDIYFCSPTCNSYSEECIEFSKTENMEDYYSCNMEKGHCDTECQGVGSCQDGYICQSGRCWLKTD